MKALWILFFVFSVQASPLKPSDQNCNLYSALEEELQCGPQAYLQKWAVPMCQKYFDAVENPLQGWLLTSELKAWLPEVRYCLQDYLLSVHDELSCRNLNSHAKTSHISCYVETGYCDLSMISQLQLASLSYQAILLDPQLWHQSAEEITRICSEMRTYQR